MAMNFSMLLAIFNKFFKVNGKDQNRSASWKPAMKLNTTQIVSAFFAPLRLCVKTTPVRSVQ